MDPKNETHVKNANNDCFLSTLTNVERYHSKYGDSLLYDTPGYHLFSVVGILAFGYPYRKVLNPLITYVTTHYMIESNETSLTDAIGYYNYYIMVVFPNTTDWKYITINIENPPYAYEVNYDSSDSLELLPIPSEIESVYKENKTFTLINPKMLNQNDINKFILEFFLIKTKGQKNQKNQ